ncbi:Tannase/feruloyl esterase [Talaromyces proteolyticus]|uniref:Carboxylic ester hydrolase n=1 Tax=Talaromyces proteolyticus TaxID=1131652 RepID=A0AAD4PSH5_9EURO|nr:Tannase/feruloyl esterase [Talaromyces proteolyticus]KAH8688951.1 Tannase/feruloyl esterase [Talaromyces proteolyticus]
MRCVLLFAWLTLRVTAAKCSASFFSSLLPQNYSLSYASHVPENGTFTDSWADGNATSLPEGCAVGLQVQTANGSQFQMAMYLPSDWNNRFMATGNGGFGGYTAWISMGALAQYGFATLSTNTGHQSSQLDGSWALNNPEAIINWAWRAMHMGVVIGKNITTGFYNSSIQYSYYAGCSTGGRQGLKEVQEFPDDFDGALIGAPAWWMDNLPVYGAWLGAHNLPVNASYHVSPQQLQMLAREAVRQCDPQDGVEDGIVMRPRECKFTLEPLHCTSSVNISSTCFSDAQMGTVQYILDDWVSITEGDEPVSLDADWIYDFLLNVTSYNWADLNYGMIELSNAINPGTAQASKFDISAFKERGGKIIHYHGYADEIIPTESSRYYYDHVRGAFLNSLTTVTDFYRFFYIPGMEHCTSSSMQEAPWYIGAALQPAAVQGLTYGVPGYEDRYHDSILALMAWTENDTAPDYLVATKYIDDDISKGIQRQRPLCPYPQLALYVNGDVNQSTSWICN